MLLTNHNWLLMSYTIFLYSTFDLKCDSSSSSLQETKNKKESNNDHDIETSKYMLECLLPYLRQLDLEQMAEMEIEAKIQGVVFLQESLLQSLFFFSFLLMSFALLIIHSFDTTT